MLMPFRTMFWLGREHIMCCAVTGLSGGCAVGCIFTREWAELSFWLVMLAVFGTALRYSSRIANRRFDEWFVAHRAPLAG